MKNSLLLLTLLLTATAGFTQQPLIKKPEWKKHTLPGFKNGDNILSDTLKDKLKRAKDLIAKNYKNQWTPLSSATFSHNTSKGKVYTMPVDNMPCLVPDMKQVMPMPGNYGPFPNRSMPNVNPVPSYPVIPKEEKKEDKK